MVAMTHRCKRVCMGHTIMSALHLLSEQYTYIQCIYVYIILKPRRSVARNAMLCHMQIIML